MTKRIGNRIFLYDEPNGQCDLCGKIDELRPYGANGECICIECGMKDVGTTGKMACKALFGIKEGR